MKKSRFRSWKVESAEDSIICSEPNCACDAEGSIIINGGDGLDYNEWTPNDLIAAIEMHYETQVERWLEQKKEEAEWLAKQPS